MSKRSLLVDKRFPEFNCAQTVFILFADEMGIDQKTVLKIASGFGGGMARAETCGAVTGSYFVLGLKYGNVTSEPEKKALIKSKIQEFNTEFEKKHGTLICKKLIGYDISFQEEAEKARDQGVFTTMCPKFIKTACSILEEMI